MKNKKCLALGLSALFLMHICGVTAILHKSRKRNRRFGVRPINRKRETEGLYATLVRDMLKLEWDQDQFFKYTRMTQEQFVYLHSLVGSQLKKDPKKLHISSKQRLIMTLHFLSEGCSMQEIAWGYRIGKTSARNIIVETCRVISDTLYSSQLPVPGEDQFKNIAKEFFARWNIPNCIGAVDGKHITIQAPAKAGSEFFNYKKSHSIVLMACCDAYYRFTMIDIGAAGSNHDSTVFKNSGLGAALLQGTLKIPPPVCLPKTNLLMPHFVVADAAFPLHKNIVRPYAGINLGEKKNIFNYRISRARRTIEAAFGILSQRWRILRKPINTKVDVAELIVQATVLLHNYLQNSEIDLPIAERKYCPTGYTDSIDKNSEIHPGVWAEEGSGLRSVSRVGSNNPSTIAKHQRDTLADYFVSPAGALPWQEEYVNRGLIPSY